MRLNQLNTMDWMMAAIGAGVGLLLGIVTMWPKPFPLLVVDMNRAIVAPSVMLAHSKLTHEQQLKIMARFSHTLPKVISDYGRTHRVTLIGAPLLASYKSSPVDVTDELIALTLARIKHEAR